MCVQFSPDRTGTRQSDICLCRYSYIRHCIVRSAERERERERGREGGRVGGWVRKRLREGEEGERERERFG